MSDTQLVREVAEVNRRRRVRRWLLGIAGALAAVAMAAGTVFYLRPLEVVEQTAYWLLRSQGVESHYVTVDGHRIHYYVAGKGDPLVLVHGLGGKAEDWTALLPQFARAGYRVYALDLLGYGRSEKPADASFSIAQEAGVVRGFLDSQGLDRVKLIGWSMGGWISMRLAADHPERVERLVLMDSAGLRFDLNWDTRLFTPETATEMDELDELLMPHPPKIPEFVVRDLLRRVRQNGWVVKRSIASMKTGADLMDGRLGELKMPVLVVWGKEDKLLPAAVGVAIHGEIPQSELLWLDGCGHLAPEQCAGPLGPRVVEFLKAEQHQPGRVVEIAGTK